MSLFEHAKGVVKCIKLFRKLNIYEQIILIFLLVMAGWGGYWLGTFTSNIQIASAKQKIASLERKVEQLQDKNMRLRQEIAELKREQIETDRQPGKMQTIASWIIKVGGQFRTHKGFTVTKLKDIPDGSFLFQKIVLHGHHIHDADIETYIAGITGLQILHLENVPNVTSTSLDEISQLVYLKELHLKHTGITESGIQNLGKLRDLKWLYLRGNSISDSAVETLRESLPSACRIISNKHSQAAQIIVQLEGEMVLRGTTEKISEFPDGNIHIDQIDLWSNERFTDEHAKAFEDLNLRGIDVSNTSLTDKGLQSILQNKSLRWLHVGGTKITDDGLTHLRPLKELESLDIAAPQVTDHGLKNLECVLITTLYLDTTKITNTGLDSLKNFRMLKTLSLKETAITDAGLQTIAESFPILEVLQLDHTKVTDKGLRHLHSMKKLTKLGLVGSQVTSEGVASLKKTLPNCNAVLTPNNETKRER